MSEQKLALIDGTYPSLMAGGVVATRLTNQNLDDYYGADYWGKTYYAIGGNTVTGKPTNANGFYLQVCQAGGGTTIQFLSNLNATDASAAPTLWQRGYDGNKSTWSDWEEIVTSEGSYSELGAGHLQDFLVENNKGTTGIGWWKIGTVKRESLPSQSAYSCIFLVNEVYHRAASGVGQSGLLELDVATSSAAGIVAAGLNILSGNLETGQLCIIKTTEKIELYSYLDGTYEATIWTTLSEGAESGTKIGSFEPENTFYGTTAPTGAVYAIVRNNASADDNGYSFDTNYVWHNNGQVEENTLKDGTTSLDFNDYLEEGKYEVHGDANNPAVNFPTSSSNPSSTSCDWHLRVFRRGVTYVTQVAYSVRGDGAIAIRVLSNGTWGNWQLLFDNGVAQQIPAASQTQLGGAYIFKDSDGYLNINTEQ